MSQTGKPARQKKLPSYLLHKASGQARVRINGKDHYLGPYGSEESRIAYGKLIARPDGTPVDPLKKSGQVDPGITVAALALAYLRHAEGYYVKNGEQTHEVSCIKSALRHLTKTYGMTSANQFGSLSLKAVRQSMIDSKKMCRKFINGCVGRIRRCFRWAVENELVDAAVLAKLDAVSPLTAGRCEAKDHAPRTVVPEDDINKVREIVPQRTKDMMDLQLLTGARPGELTMLTGAMIDQTGEIWIATITGHKTEHHGKQRALVFGPKAQLILRRYLHADPERRLFELTRASYSLAIKLACTKLKIKRFTAHWLRHNAASRFREEYGLDTAQTVLGHANASMTELYAHLNLDKAIEVARNAG